MAELFTLPRARPLTSAGKVMPASKLYFYAVGTTTLAAIYSDEAGTVAHTNPVVADANGEFEEIYLTADRDVVLKTSADVELWGPITVSVNNSASDVSFTPSSGATATDVQSFLRVNAERTAREIAAGVTPTNYAYAEGDPRRYGTVSSSANSTPAVQAAINVMSSASYPGYGWVELPAGTIRCDAPLSLPSQYVSIRGKGRWHTRLVFHNVTSGSCIAAAAIQYLRPVFSGFSVEYSGTTNQKAIDTTAVTVQMYDFLFEDMYVVGYKQAFHCRPAFQGEFARIDAGSTTEHVFHVQCGPGVMFRSCAPTEYPATKAGFRLAGTVHLENCNGPFPSVLDATKSGYFGVFGNDTTSTDGFQTDFADNDIPIITVIGTNAEDWGKAAYRIQSNYQICDIIGGTIQHNNIAQPYEALIYARKGSNTSSFIQPIRVGCRVFKNAQNAIGSGAYTDAFLFAETGAIFEDSGSANIDDFENFRVGATTYPLVRNASNIHNSTAFSTAQAFRARHLDIRSHGFSEQTVTSTGANQAINVTGFSKIVLSPGSASSFDRFFFDATVGDKDQDYGRNGLLMVEATNGNATLNHNIASAGGMRMAGAANLTLAAGQVVLFCWSGNYSGTTDGWIQI